MEDHAIVVEENTVLITITSSTSGEMIMFADDTRRLFEIIGKACTARGIFTHEQLPDAITKLQASIDQEKLASHLGRMERKSQNEDKDEEEAENEHPSANAVLLGQRAVPLLRLMERTWQEKGFILWETEKDF